MRFLETQAGRDGQLDGRDVVAIMAPASEKAQTTKHNLSAWRARGPSPFTRQPLQQPHILATNSAGRYNGMSL